MGALLQDLRYALRQLRRSPGFTAAAVLTLALGIGVNAAMFGVMDTILFRPPAGVTGADRVVRPYAMVPSHWGSYATDIGSYPDYTDLRDHARTLEAVAAYAPLDLSLGRGVDAELVHVQAVTPQFFGVLGVRPEFGRFFSVDEDALPRGISVVVLGSRFWKRHFGGSRTVLGQRLQLGRLSYVIIGVTPSGFAGPDLHGAELWVPMSTVAADLVEPEWATSRGDFSFRRIARLRNGVTAEQASAETTLIYRGAHLKDEDAQVVCSPIQSARGPKGSHEATLSRWLMSVSVVVLLIACANIANLFLARAVRRRREIAVRLTLGASHGRLVRQLLVESALLGLLGGAVAVLMVWWSSDALRILLLPSASSADFVNGRIFAFTAIVALGSGLLAGLASFGQLQANDLTVNLKAGPAASTPRPRLRSTLLIGQVALSLVLLTGAGLLIRSFHNVLQVDQGFDQDNVLIASFDLKAAGFTPTQTGEIFERALERVQSLPGVSSASLAAGGPYGWSYGMSVRLPGRDSLPDGPDGGPYLNSVTPDFFTTLGTRIIKGRGFTAADRKGAPEVIVVGDAMARLYWPSADPVGTCVYLGDGTRCHQVVGIAKATHRMGLLEKPSLLLYVPLAQDEREYDRRDLFVRTAGNSEALIEPIRRTMQSVAPDLPYVNARPMASLLEYQLRPWRVGAILFSSFGCLALLLATVGLYAVVAYQVAERTREVGIRMALGADRSSVMALVLAEGMRLTLIGLVIGSVAALLGGPLLAALLYGVSPRDPVVLVAASLPLLATAALASFLPARRAARVDPMVALRSE